MAVVFCLASVCLAQNAEVMSGSALGNANGAKAETPLGDLFADSIRALLVTDAAFVAASEIKPKDPPIPAGKVSLSDVTSLISYPDDSLAVLSLNGKTLKQTLERAVSIYPQPNLGFLQVSGVTFAFDPRKPSGERVLNVTAGGAPVSDDRAYTVAVTNSMANGALGYWKLWTKDDVRARAPEATIAKALAAYFKANPRINYDSLGRITTR